MSDRVIFARALVHFFETRCTVLLIKVKGSASYFFTLNFSGRLSVYVGISSSVTLPGGMLQELKSGNMAVKIVTTCGGEGSQQENQYSCLIMNCLFSRYKTFLLIRNLDLQFSFLQVRVFLCSQKGENKSPPCTPFHPPHSCLENNLKSIVGV